MAEKKERVERKKFKLKVVRLSYPYVFKVRPAFEEGQKEKFAATALLDPTNESHRKSIKAMTAEMILLGKTVDIKEELIKSIYNGAESTKVSICMGKGDKKENRDGDVPDGYEGMIWLNATSMTRPLVVDRKRNPIAESDGIIFGGCYVNMNVEMYSWKYKAAKRGVGANLVSIQFVKDGDAFGRAPVDADTEFDPLDDEDDSDDGDDWDD